MDDELKSLLIDIKHKLESDCEHGWDRLTSVYIMGGDYSREEQKSKGRRVGV